MFIRAKTVKGRTYYQVVKGERKDGKVRQVVVLALGPHATLAEAHSAALRKMEHYGAILERAMPGGRVATRCANSIAKLETFIDKLWDVWEQLDDEPDDPSGHVGTTPDDVVPEDAGWFAGLREEARKANWPDADRYVYRMHDLTGVGGKVYWYAHAIISRDDRAIIYTDASCYLAKVAADGPKLLASAAEVDVRMRVVNTAIIVGRGHADDALGVIYPIGETVRQVHRRVAEEWEAEARAWQSRWDRGAFSSSPAASTADYATLGVKPGATAAEVKAAYRRRAKEVHPDRGGSAEAFREVAAAYERISKGAA